MTVVVAIVFLASILQSMETSDKITYISVERPAVTYIDTDYITFANCSARRYSRSDPVYYYNLLVELARPFSNNVTVHFYFFEWLTNRYKQGFIEMHFLWCDLIHKDMFFGAAMRKSPDLAKPCPHGPGLIRMTNCTIPTASIPKGFPFTKGRIYANVSTTKTNLVIASGYVDMEIKQIRVKKKT